MRAPKTPTIQNLSIHQRRLRLRIPPPSFRQAVTSAACSSDPRSRAAERRKNGPLDCQPPFVEAMEVSITHEQRAERVGVEYDQVTPGHTRSKIPRLIKQMTEKSQSSRRR